MVTPRPVPALTNQLRRFLGVQPEFRISLKIGEHSAAGGTIRQMREELRALLDGIEDYDNKTVPIFFTWQVNGKSSTKGTRGKAAALIGWGDSNARSEIS